MGVYKRRLAKGVRWYYSGQYLGAKYFSKAIYLKESEAKRAEAEKIKEMDERARSPYVDMKFFDLCEQRLDILKLKKSNDYYKESQRYFKRALAEWGKEIYVSKITKKMVNDLLMKEARRLQRRGKTNHKLNAMIRCLKSLFNWGIKVHDLSIRNPVFGLELYSVKIRLKHIPKELEIQMVRDWLNCDQLKLFDFVEETGCRVQEAVRFRYEDIDGDLITLYTRKSKNSDYTPRRIPKPACLNGAKGRGKVFKTWNAYPRFLEEAVNELDLPGWNWHNLRHRRASLWASQGMTTLEIMTRLGHNNLSTTMKYLQLLGFSRL